MQRFAQGLALVTLLAIAWNAAIAQQAPPEPPPSAPAPAPPAKPEPAPQKLANRVFFGGGIGMAFGDVDVVEVWPMIGYRATPRLSVGGSLLYRYRNDDRYPVDLTTSDYGVSGFARWDFYRGLFGHLEYEYLDYEYVNADLSTDREGFSSILLGPGFAQSIGRNSSVYFTALYNLSYDDSDLRSPYADPWVIRVGVGFGF